MGMTKYIFCIFMLFFIQSSFSKKVTVSNIQLPNDNFGNALLTGELDVLEHKGVYYFYFNNWGGCAGVDCCPSSAGCAACCFNPPSSQFPDACVYTTNHSVLVYNSSDFVSFEFVGVALPEDARLAGIEFRPHVIYNALNDEFVMWYEDRWNGQTGYAVAVSPSPAGPFKTVNNTVNMGGDGRIGDYDLFVDSDGTAYHVRTGLIIEQLTPDYRAGTGAVYTLPNAGVEGPSMFEREGWYYVLVGVGCCACRGGSNVVVYKSSSPLGPYTLQGDVGSNPQPFNKSSPFNYVTRAQQSVVVPVPDESNTLQYVWIGNQWVTSSLPWHPRNNDLLYWTVLDFDSNGDILQMVYSENTTISLLDS